MKRKYQFDENYFQYVDTEKKAYFLGLLFADGYLWDGKNAYVGISLMEKDYKVLEILRNDIKSNYSIAYRKASDEEHSDSVYLQINSKQFNSNLKQWGMHQNKTNTIQFPYGIPIYLYPHFIRGYFDGNGSVWEGERKVMQVKDSTRNSGFRDRIVHNVKFNITGCEFIIKSIQKILIEKAFLNVTKLNLSKKCINSAMLEYSGRIQMQKFYNFIYKDSTVCLERKKKKFENIICANV